MPRALLIGFPAPRTCKVQPVLQPDAPQEGSPRCLRPADLSRSIAPSEPFRRSRQFARERKPPSRHRLSSSQSVWLLRRQ